MIVTEQKPFEEILDYLKDINNIFIVGCGECATTCSTGGEKEVIQISEKLKNEYAKIITGWVVIESPCDIRLVKKYFRLNKESIEEAEAILVMACGAGIGAIRDVSPKKLIPALNGLYLGTTERLGRFKEYCSLCKNCVLDITDGYCPVTRCAKGLLNGPCGGSVAGKCEVDIEKDCVWALIINRLKERNELNKLLDIMDTRKYV